MKMLKIDNIIDLFIFSETHISASHVQYLMLNKGVKGTMKTNINLKLTNLIECVYIYVILH